MIRYLAHRVVGDTSIVYHGARAPTSEDWDAYLKAGGPRQGVAANRSLIISDGGALTSTQRKHLKAQIPDGERAPPMALLTDSALLRGSVLAMSWLGFAFDFSAFRRNEFELACDHLGILGAHREACRRAIEELRAELKSAARATG